MAERFVYLYLIDSRNQTVLGVVVAEDGQPVYVAFGKYAVEIGQYTSDVFNSLIEIADELIHYCVTVKDYKIWLCFVEHLSYGRRGFGVKFSVVAVVVYVVDLKNFQFSVRIKLDLVLGGQRFVEIPEKSLSPRQTERPF